MSTRIVVRFDPVTGRARFIYDDVLAGVVERALSATVTRVSNVEYSVESRGWMADLSPTNGPTLGPFAERQQAIDAEIAWLLEHQFGVKEQPYVGSKRVPA